MFFSKISFKFILDFLSISIKYHKSYFINCITKFNLNPINKVLCNYIVVIVRWICYKYLESVGEYIVNESVSNLGVEKFVFCFIFCTLKWAWLYFDLPSIKHTWNVIPSHRCINVAYCCNTIVVHILQWTLKLICFFFFNVNDEYDVLLIFSCKCWL